MLKKQRRKLLMWLPQKSDRKQEIKVMAEPINLQKKSHVNSRQINSWIHVETETVLIMFLMWKFSWAINFPIMYSVRQQRYYAVHTIALGDYRQASVLWKRKESSFFPIQSNMALIRPCNQFPCVKNVSRVLLFLRPNFIQISFHFSSHTWHF